MFFHHPKCILANGTCDLNFPTCRCLHSWPHSKIRSGGTLFECAKRLLDDGALQAARLAAPLRFAAAGAVGVETTTNSGSLRKT